MIVVPNQRLLDHVAAGKSVEEAFALADDVVRQGVQVRVLVATLSTVGFCRTCSARLISLIIMKLAGGASERRTMLKNRRKKDAVAEACL